MGIETALAASVLIGAGSSIIGGIEKRNEAKDQASLVIQESNVQAQQELDDADRFARGQKMSYIKSGVLLSGSPLLVMADTYNKGAKNAANIRSSGASKAQLLRKQGSAAFTQGVVGAAQSIGSGFLKGYDMGLYGGGGGGALVNTASDPGYSGPQYDANNNYLGTLLKG